MNYVYDNLWCSICEEEFGEKGRYIEALNLPNPNDPMGSEYAEYSSYSHAYIAGLFVHSCDQAAPGYSAGLFRFPANV